MNDFAQPLLDRSDDCSLDTVYLVHHSHMDIGFTDLADEVRQQHLCHLDLALELCNQPKVGEGGTKFRWMIESAWIVEDYLRLRSGKQVERLLAALRSGQLELGAFYAQPLTESAGAEELIDSVKFAAELGREHGFAVHCAMLNDIGGYMARLPSVLSGWGVRYLVAGVGAYQVHMPWCDLPHLFYLQDKAGARILVWNLGIDRTRTPQSMTYLDAVYSMGETYLLTPTRFKSIPEAFGHLTHRLAQERYPYSQVMLQYASDNCGPDPRLLSRLAALGQHPSLPRVELTTPIHFFKMMEQRYADRIPVLSGVITDPWVLRANPQPAPLGQYRAAQRRLLAAEAHTITSTIPQAKFSNAYQSLHLFTDHTCGLNEWDWPVKWQSDPDCRAATFDRYRQSWRDKARCADTALCLANELDCDARQRMVSHLTGLDPAIIVWNDRACSASALAQVMVPRQQDASLLKSVQDAATGKMMQLQRVDAKRYLIEAVDVPPFGYRILKPQWEKEAHPWENPHAHALDSCPSAMESDRLLLTLDPATGAIRQVTDKQTGDTWLPPSSANGLGEFQYARVTNVSQTWQASGMAGGIKHQWISGKLGRVWKTMDGPLVFALARERIFETHKQPLRVIEQISLYAGEARIDFRYRIDKPQTARKESCYIRFGFDLPGATFRCDQAIGWVEPGADLMAGAMQDAFYAAQWADLSTSARGVTLVCHEAPLLQVGRVRTYEWNDKLPFEEDGSNLIAWPYHNLPQTDNPIWQDVLMNVHYSLFLHRDEGFDPVRCDREADIALRPLRTQLANAGPNIAPSQSGIALESQTVRWVGCHLLPDGQTVCVRLEERAGRHGEAILCFDGELEWARKPDLFFNDRAEGKELNTQDSRVCVSTKPFELVTVLIRLRTPSRETTL